MLRQYLELPRSVYVLAIGMFVNRAGTMVLPFLTLYVQRELNFSAALASWAMGAYGGGALAAALIGGHLADRIGRRIVMITALVGGAAMLLLLSRMTHPAAVLASVFVFAMVADMYRPAASAMIADLVKPELRSHAFGLVYYAINLGFCVAAVVGGQLAEHSFSLLFWADAGTCAAYALIILLAIRETLPSRAGADAPTGAVTSEAAVVPLGAALSRIMRDRAFVIFAMASLLTATVFMQSMSTFPLYGQALEKSAVEGTAAGFGIEMYGWLIAINAVMIVLVQLPLTSFLTGFNRGTVIAVGALMVGVGFGLKGFAVLPWHFALTIVVWTTGELMQAPFMNAVVGDMAPVNLRARYMGVFGMSFSFAMMVGVPIGGIVLDRRGGGVLWAGCFVLGLLSMAMYLSIRKQMAVPQST